MRKTIAVSMALALSGGAIAATPQFEDLSRLDTRIAAFLAATAPGAALQVQPLDRRLRMTSCPEGAAIERPIMAEVVVRVSSIGWRLRVPVAAPIAAMLPVAVRRGDNVTLAVSGAGFDILTVATALEDGREGGPVRVKTSTSVIPLTARVEGPGRVALSD